MLQSVGVTPGTGKTHLAIGLGIKAAQTGHRVLFATATEWVTRLQAAHATGRLSDELTRLRRYGLLIVDEVGYIPFEQDAANLFFQLVSSRYEHPPSPVPEPLHTSCTRGSLRARDVRSGRPPVAFPGVMSLHKLTAGDGYTYLTRQVAVHDATERGRSGLADYYSDKGESPGWWWGAGLAGLGLQVGAEVTEQQMRNLYGEGRHPDAERLEDAVLDRGGGAAEALKASRLGRAFPIHAGGQSEFRREVARRFTAYNADRGVTWRTPIPADERARIRTEVADDLFAREHGRPPLDDRERSAFIARHSRAACTAVAGYDLAFTPVKSVSTLWALADLDVARQVQEAHGAAVEKTLGYLEREVLFTRRGRGGVQQVKARGLVAAAFTHRDSRAGDPNLHTHVAVSNKVQDLDGRWLSVDGRVLFQANVTLSETYNTYMEAELVARLGVRFAARPGRGDGTREVREVVGVAEPLTAAWSRRTARIEARRRELVVRFQADHGRPPTAVEAIALSQQATLETRQAKHPPRSEADQRAAWRSEAVAVLGSEDAVDHMVSTALGHRAAGPPVTSEWLAQTAREVAETVEASRATWQMWHLRAEAQRRARAADVGLDELDRVVDLLVETASTAHSIAFPGTDPLAAPGAGPDVLTRPDGSSVYTVHGSQLFTSQRIVDAERRLLAHARTGGGRRVDPTTVGIALAESAANGVRLDRAQRELVHAMATSGRQVQLALAPAGTGKTTALEVLARAWREGGGTVVGLAPSAAAARQLRESVGADVVCETLSKLVWSLRPTESAPTWVTAIGSDTLVLVDEAGMASTTDLAAVADFVTSRGGSVRLIGDTRQLAAVAAGGALRDIAHQEGAVTLTEVHRFSDSTEAAVTLAVRDGDVSALGFYADRGRIHVGDLAGAAEQAYRAWSTDVAAGRHSLLLAPTRLLVAELNTRARQDRLAGRPTGPSAALVDGTHASAGDTVLTRRNDRSLRVGGTDWVKNGDRWTVRTVHGDGTIDVCHQALRRVVRLPAAYVAEHVQLGYAATIHGAQGITADTTHTVLTGQEDRALLYVAVSRGRHRNDVYLASASDGDPHDVIRRDTLLPPTALDTLTQILGRDDSAVSATSARRDAEDPTLLLREAATRYHDALLTAAQERLGPAGMGRIDSAGGTVPGLTEAEAWPALRAHLALLAAHGHDPVTTLASATRAGPLTDARDRAAVVHDRTAAPPAGPLPWLPEVPARMIDDPQWGRYLAARRAQVTERAHRLADTALGWTPAAAPGWARPFLDPTDTRLRARLAVWRAANDVPDSDHRPTGEPRIGAPGDHQAALDRAVRGASHPADAGEFAWFERLPDRVRNDAWTPLLRQRLQSLTRRGLDVEELVMRAMAEDRPLPDQHPASALWWRLVPIARSAAAKDLAALPAARPTSMTAIQRAMLGYHAETQHLPMAPLTGESPQPPVSR